MKSKFEPPPAELTRQDRHSKLPPQIRQHLRGKCQHRRGLDLIGQLAFFFMGLLNIFIIAFHGRRISLLLFYIFIRGKRLYLFNF